MAKVRVGNWEDEADAGGVLAAKAKVVTDAPAAISSLNQHANSGSIKARLILADLYMRGRYVPRDLAQAAHWYLELGKAGIVFGEHMAGDMKAREGLHNEARALFEKCAAVEFLPSIYRSAYMLAEGLGGPQDLGHALRLLKIAENKGHHGAKIYYSHLLMTGRLGGRQVPAGIYTYLLGRAGLFFDLVKSGGEIAKHWDDTYML